MWSPAAVGVHHVEFGVASGVRSKIEFEPFALASGLPPQRPKALSIPEAIRQREPDRQTQQRQRQNRQPHEAPPPIRIIPGKMISPLENGRFAKAVDQFMRNSKSRRAERAFSESAITPHVVSFNGYFQRLRNKSRGEIRRMRFDAESSRMVAI